MKSISLSEAKAKFSDCVRTVERGELLFITRHDKPVAALVRPENIEQLERLRAVGPEGGFQDDEIGLAITAGWTPISLGSRTLRVETAAITLASYWAIT